MVIYPGDIVTWSIEHDSSHALWFGPGEDAQLDGPSRRVQGDLPVFVIHVSEPYQNCFTKPERRLLVIVGDVMGWIWDGWVRPC